MVFCFLDHLKRSFFANAVENGVGVAAAAATAVAFKRQCMTTRLTFTFVPFSNTIRGSI